MRSGTSGLNIRDKLKLFFLSTLLISNLYPLFAAAAATYEAAVAAPNMATATAALQNSECSETSILSLRVINYGRKHEKLNAYK